MTLSEKASYIKGLCDGMELDTTTKEGKLLAALIDLVDDMAKTVEDHEEAIDEIDGAIDELIELGHLSEDGGLLALTEKGREAAQDLSARLPYTLRQRAVTAALELLARERRAKENSFSVQKLPQGCAVTCRIHEGDSDLLSLTVQVADEQQANLLGQNFISDPVALYQAIFSLLIGPQ